MTADVELHVRFDGNAPGLAGHALSLSAFQRALSKLLIAFRRSASAVLSGTDEEPIAGPYKRFVRHLDLQIAALSDGCVQLTLKCGSATADPTLDARGREVVEAAIRRVLSAIDNAAAGGAVSSSVRGFLDAVPAGVTRQEYEARANGAVIGRASVGPIAAERRLTARPRLVKVKGRVSSITFDAQRGRVRIRDIAGVTHTCHADPDVIEKAVDLRHETIEGQLLERHDLKRLLLIYAEGSPPPTPTAEERLTRILERWGGTLRRLAE